MTDDEKARAVERFAQHGERKPTTHTFNIHQTTTTVVSTTVLWPLPEHTDTNAPAPKRPT